MIEQGVLTHGAQVPSARVVVGVRRVGGATRSYRTCGGDEAAQNFFSSYPSLRLDLHKSNSCNVPSDGN